MNIARERGLLASATDQNPAWRNLLACPNLLFLQGPVGPFFDRLAHRLRSGGAAVTRIAFHGGDLWDSRMLPAVPFCGHPSEWRSFLSDLLTTRDIGGVVLFGQSRFYHAVALDVCEQHGVETFVFEKSLYGSKAVGQINAALTIGSMRSDSLMNHTEMGAIQAKAFRTRVAYRESFIRWHDDCKRRGVIPVMPSAFSAIRPYSVPRKLRVSHQAIDRCYESMLAALPLKPLERG